MENRIDVVITMGGGLVPDFVKWVILRLNI